MAINKDFRIKNGLIVDGSASIAGIITGTLEGNASTASKLQTARTISLTGDVTGSVSFDGSQNVTISTTVVGSGGSGGGGDLSQTFLLMGA